MKFLYLVEDKIKHNKDSLFWIPLMRHFYDKDKENDEDVLEGWYQYNYFFLSICSKQWSKNLSSDRLKYKDIIMKSVSESDEALVRWMLNLWYPIIQKWYDDGCREDDNKVGNGAHDAKRYRDRYTNLHNEISNIRRDENINLMLRWNSLFWHEVETRHKSMYQEKAIFRYHNTHINLSLPKADRFNQNLFNGMVTTTDTIAVNRNFNELTHKDNGPESIKSAKNVQII
jgi:hypothetical protein